MDRLRRPRTLWIVLAGVWAALSFVFFYLINKLGIAVVTIFFPALCTPAGAKVAAHCADGIASKQDEMMAELFWQHEIYWIVIPALLLLLIGTAIASLRTPPVEAAPPPVA